MRYERPKLTLLGKFTDLTRAGNDPCRDVGPHGTKQTGPADLVQGQAELMTCSI